MTKGLSHTGWMWERPAALPPTLWREDGAQTPHTQAGEGWRRRTGLTSPSILLSVAAFSALMLGSGLRGGPHRTPQPTPMRSDHSPLALLFYLPQGSDSWQNSGWTGAGGACQASRGRGPSWTLRQHSWGHHFHQDPSACRCLPCTQLFPVQSLAELSARPAPGTQSPSSSWQSKYGPGQEEVPPPSRSSLVNRVRVTSQALGRRPGEPRSVAHGSTYCW